MYDDITSAVTSDLGRVREELEALIRIPSISAPSFDPAPVRRSAETVAELLRSSGASGVRLLELEGAHPAVYGEILVSADAPTVLLYAHHDVQPAGRETDWDSDPFTPVEIDGRLYARGSADDKAGIAMHVASVRALGSSLPVNVKFFIEGEEEIGSRHLPEFLEAYADDLAADVIVIGDAGNWAPGVPAFTTSLRGLIDCVVTVRTLAYAVHSGSFGGVYPDAITALAHLLARLHHEDGSVAVPELVSASLDGPAMTKEELDDQMLPVDGLEMIGSGSITSRLWSQPAISVLAIEAVPVDEAINQIVPEARAKVSVRLAPGQDPRAAMDALTAHLIASAPWGADVTIDEGSLGAPFRLDSSGPAYDAYRTGMRHAFGEAAVDMGNGGSIPFVAAFAERYPDAEVLLIGVADPTSRFHGPNESVELADLESAITAQAIALRLIGS